MFGLEMYILIFQRFSLKMSFFISLKHKIILKSIQVVHIILKTARPGGRPFSDILAFPSLGFILKKLSSITKEQTRFPACYKEFAKMKPRSNKRSIK